jgi:hypothetical protein
MQSRKIQSQTTISHIGAQIVSSLSSHQLNDANRRSKKAFLGVSKSTRLQSRHRRLENAQAITSMRPKPLKLDYFILVLRQFANCDYGNDGEGFVLVPVVQHTTKRTPKAPKRLYQHQLIKVIIPFLEVKNPSYPKFRIEWIRSVHMGRRILITIWCEH